MDNTEKIRRQLGWGDIKKISEETKYHRVHVSNVLAGRYKNPRIIEAAKKLASSPSPSQE